MLKQLNESQSISRALGAVGAVLFALNCPTAIAEPRALLIGIGEYPVLAKGTKLDPNLPGIDLDLDNMRQVTKIMGFQPSQVRVLYNGEATYNRVVHELNTWVRDGVRPEDPVLVYFSGHGTFIPDKNGDESDGRDEVLVMSDTGRVRTKDSVTLENVLVDDQLGALLDNVQSRRILVLVDACHSGTSTREIVIDDRHLGESVVYPKFYYYDGMPTGDESATRSKDTKEVPAKFATLSAAKDTQTAVATYKGGLFTLGLLDSIKKAAAARRNPPLIEVRDQIDAYIVGNIDPERRHNPVVTGDPSLTEGGIELVPIENGNGPLWAELQALAGKGQPLTITTSQAKYRVGEPVEIKVDVPKDGYLNVVTVDSKDQATVLYPNQFATTNAVKKGIVQLPSADMEFVLPAQEPLGPTLVVAFLSQEPINLRELGVEGRDASGKLSRVFTDVSTVGTRAIGVAAKKEAFSAGRVTVTVDAAPVQVSSQ